MPQAFKVAGMSALEQAKKALEMSRGQFVRSAENAKFHNYKDIEKSYKEKIAAIDEAIDAINESLTK